MKRLFNILAIVFTVGLFTVFSASAANKKLPQTNPGKLVRHIIYSPQLKQKINVDIWLPPGYNKKSAKRYPVIYMHDGQNLYDPKTTWNHQAWEMDSVAGALISAHKIPAPIIVGVHSIQESRVPDLMPRKVLEYIPDERTDSMQWDNKEYPLRGDLYARFITHSVKPIVDKAYNTMPDRDHTFVMGSSMGGLMSLYMLCEYPEIFGGAGCLSTHWIGKHPEGVFPHAFRDYLVDNLPRDGHHKLYFDHGTTTVDAQYGPWEDMMIDYILSQGYTLHGTLERYVAQGAAHNENFWKRRVSRPLTFLLNK